MSGLDFVILIDRSFICAAALLSAQVTRNDLIVADYCISKIFRCSLSFL